MKLQDKEGLEIASTVKDVLEGKVKKEVAQPRAKGEKEFHDLHDIEVSGEAPDGKITKAKKGNYYKEAEEPKAKGEKEFKKKHIVKKSGERPDGTVMKEGKLKAGKGKATIDVDHTGEGIPAAQRKYKIKFKRNRFGGTDISGDKKNILAYLQSKDYDMDSDDIEEFFPELLEGAKAKAEDVDEEEIEDDKEKADEQSEKQKKYQKFFNAALKKFGVKSPAELEGEKKKEFFDYVDKNYEGDNEAD